MALQRNGVFGKSQPAAIEGMHSPGPISADALKLIAMAVMFLDHTGMVLFPGDLGWRLVGRTAFPLYIWMLVMGLFYTSNVRRYLFRLCAFALLSEIPFNLAVSGGLWYRPWQNVYFTLAISLAMLWVLQRAEEMGRPMAGVWAVPAAMLVSEWLGFDYGCTGPLLAYLFYMREKKGKPVLTAGFLMFCLSNLLSPLLSGENLLAPEMLSGAVSVVCTEAFGIVSVPLIGLCNGVRRWKRGRIFFYLFYPAHLLLLSFLRDGSGIFALFL